MTLLQRHPGAALATLAAVVFVLVAASALRTPFPLVLSDEAVYLLPTLHGYSAANFERWSIVAAIPSHLYFAAYATLAGADFYAHAKVLNAGFIAATAYPIYAIARLRLPRAEAALIAALGIAAPVATYARYLMPESPYFFGGWFVLLAFLRTLARSVPLAAIVAGAGLGALSLVKPHALALAFATMAFLLLRGDAWRPRLAAAVLVAVGYGGVRVLLTFVFVGRFDPSLMGPSYATLFAAGFAPWPAIRNAAGHVLALLVLVGVPLWVVTRHVVLARARRTRADDIALLALCIVATLVAMAVVFTSSVYAIAPEGERITRLHGRYYTFALPLPIIAFAALSREAEPWHPRRWAILLWGSATLAAVVGLAIGYETGFVDFPDLSLLTRWPEGALLAVLAAGCCFVAARAAPRRAPLAWWGTLAVVTSLALLAAPFAGKAFKPNAVDHALATPALRSLAGRDDVMVVGGRQDAGETYRVMFHLASRARGRLEAAGTVIAPAQVPADVHVLILLPHIAFGGAAATTQVGPLTLVMLP